MWIWLRFAANIIIGMIYSNDYKELLFIIQIANEFKTFQFAQTALIRCFANSTKMMMLNDQLICCYCIRRARIKNIQLILLLWLKTVLLWFGMPKRELKQLYCSESAYCLSRDDEQIIIIKKISSLGIIIFSFREAKWETATKQMRCTH